MQTHELHPLPKRVGRLRVLIVEDERRLRTLLVETIGELDVSATGAGSAEEALAIMQSDPHEIAMLDLHLPGMSGMELFERIRACWPATQVVVLTAFGDLTAARRAVHLDAVEFLTKPFHLREIDLALDRARRRLNDPMARVTSLAQAHEQASASMEPPPTLAQIEHAQILAALERNAGNRTVAAIELGISRRTLHYRLAEYRQQDDQRR